MRKIFLLKSIVFLAVVAVCTSGITYGYIGNETSKLENNFSPKKYTDVEINEPNGNNYIINSEGNLTQSKSASFENPNNNTKDEYIRAKVIGIIRNEDQSNAGKLPNLNIMYNNSSDWIKRGDYYYYKKIVKPGESTSNLFQDITVGQDTLSLLSQGQYIEVNVIVDSIESTKFKDAWGFDVEELSII